MNTTTAAHHAATICRATRRHDWNALNFQADLNPKPASAPMLLRRRVKLIAGNLRSQVKR